MNIGICIDQTPDNMREKFENAARVGFRHCQLVSWDPILWNRQEAEFIKKYTKDFGISITAFWCGWVGPKQWNFYEGPETLGLVPSAFRFQRMQNLMDGADFAKMMDVTDVVSHMGFIPETPASAEYTGFVACLRTIASYLKRNGQRLLFETGQETPITLLRCIEDIGTGNLYANLDPANLIMYGKGNPVDALRVIGRYIGGVHAKDGMYPTDGRNLGLEVKIGEGMVDFPALIKGLKALHFDGSLTIEREIRGEQQFIDIEDAREYMQNIIKELDIC